MSNYVLSGYQWTDYTVTWAYYGDLDYYAEIQAAVDAWDAEIELDFTQVSYNSDPDILIYFDYIDGTYSTLGETITTYYPSTGEIVGVEIVMDSAEDWIWNGSEHTLSSGTTFYEVIAHELGHAIGLDHATNPDTLLYAYANGNADDLTGWDIYGAQLIYGPETSFSWSYGWYEAWAYGWWADGWTYGWHQDWYVGWHYAYDYGWHIAWSYGWHTDWAYGWYGTPAYGWHEDWFFGWSLQWAYGTHNDWYFGWNTGWYAVPDYGWYDYWQFGWYSAWDFGSYWSIGYGWYRAWDYGWDGDWSYGWYASGWTYGWYSVWDYGWDLSWNYGWYTYWNYGWH